MVGNNTILNTITLLSATLTTYIPLPYNPGFSIKNVLSLPQSLPHYSSEYGTSVKAQLELLMPQFSIFGTTPFLIPALPAARVIALNYALSKVDFGTGYVALSAGSGAVGDLLSLGVSAVMLGKLDGEYMAAAKETVDVLLTQIPRWSNGVISHRPDVAELWADFVYMVPPFLAYYGADTQNASVLLQSYTQCQLYQQVLQPSSGSAWMHIMDPQNQDTGLWSTGNGWAAAGMTRVFATFLKSPFAQQLNGSAQVDAVEGLTGYIKEILDGAMSSPMSFGLLRNYLNDTSGDGQGFPEISGSTLLESVAYRKAVLCPDVFSSSNSSNSTSSSSMSSYISWADNIHAVLGAYNASGNPHITKTGIATPAVNTLDWHDTTPYTSGSPEGQNFMVLMQGATTRASG
ncbi:uncharacterized protein LACBIDRAFT_310937 [Laccaria bicolor S238N-H82]|uniref:Predicted protein n=1 Tax=Laccaria bicolor (strain S238N-H82 / ATCC MYA-4686) TaxID=486041 RepID=B0DF64_LACBS|nr:uncharacterized protein LACBIDRAFT_299686 [Laccaria bicolor S238N-H82]XP_001891250.1 uncharacterized protein LACBIDRAFT_310937 [Laccaria bicolor S238N-H82]EDQ98100.1 predicted protein [Laccaria bicolor S238N-H82]EDR06800.1 predicted protein [Laccaria bicolor S238N-H82]|eukprot:XP_001882647.1 predicted protein [Laccaria bicolor S238N-H82]